MLFNVSTFIFLTFSVHFHYTSRPHNYDLYCVGGPYSINKSITPENCKPLSQSCHL